VQSLDKEERQAKLAAEAEKKRAKQQEAADFAQKVLEELQRQPVSHGEQRIQEELSVAAKWIASADAILICSGSGATAAPLQLPGGMVYHSAKDFAKSYPWLVNFGYTSAKDCAKLCNDERLSLEEKWGFWGHHSHNVRVGFQLDKRCVKSLEAMLTNKDYFIYTCSTDGSFERAGFDKDRIYTPQGDWSYYQCKTPCSRDAVFKRYSVPEQLLSNMGVKGKPPSMPAPLCSKCGGPCVPNIRMGDWFSHEMYDAPQERFIKWVEKHAANKTNLVVIELDGCFKTDRVMRFPLESILSEMSEAALVRLSTEVYPFVPNIIEKAVGLPVSKFSEVLKALPKVSGAVTDQEQSILNERRQRSKNKLSTGVSSEEQIHWKRALGHLRDSFFNRAYEKSM